MTTSALKTRVMDLPEWVPQPGGPTSPGETFPLATDQVTFERVIGVFGEHHLMFMCRFNGRSVSYNYPLLDPKTAATIANILNENIGNTLLSIGTIEIPEDDE
jgi:hypothetical protein